MPRLYPKNLTSLDLLKSFAVIIMIVDHLGAYFFPDQVWWRVIGRVGFPIWFFLVGYSTGRSIPAMLWGGAILLEVFNFVVGMALFPLNALFTIIIIRLILDKIMDPIMEGRRSIWPLSLLMFLLVLPSYMITDYGTQALITAVFGYLVRHRDRLADKRIVFFYMWFALISFVVLQQLIFGLDYIQMGVVFAGTLIIRAYLYNLKMLEFPKLTETLPRLFVWPLQFMGRRTLEIFIVHLIIFKLVAAQMFGLPEYSWFTLRWWPE